MRRFAPLLTLLAVAALGGALLTPTWSTAPRTPPARRRPPPRRSPPSPRRRPARSAARHRRAARGARRRGGEKAYAGRTAGNEVTVAIAVKDGRAVGYVCDGKKIEAWLEGTLRARTSRSRARTGSRRSPPPPTTGSRSARSRSAARSGRSRPRPRARPRGCTRAAPTCAACSTGSAGSCCRTGRRRAVWNRGGRRGGARRCSTRRAPTPSMVDGVPVDRTARSAAATR